jgi:hypothetical protein
MRGNREIHSVTPALYGLQRQEPSFHMAVPRLRPRKVNILFWPFLAFPPKWMARQLLKALLFILTSDGFFLGARLRAGIARG